MNKIKELTLRKSRSYKGKSQEVTEEEVKLKISQVGPLFFFFTKGVVFSQGAAIFSIMFSC